MIKASVVIATYRPLGAVIPLRALREQAFKGFEVVLVTEIGAKAWGGGDGLFGAIPGHTKVVEAPYIKYHSPAHALNRGIDAASGEIIVLLTDFAYPDSTWLQTLVDTLTSRPVPFVGGVKCSHGTADVWTCKPHTCNRPLLPLGVQTANVPDVVVVFPFQAGFNLGNAAFYRADAKRINGIDERFAGDYGYEDENFVRRLVALRKCQAVLTKKAVIHHYWPYSSGYKPLFKMRGTMGGNKFLGTLTVDSEILTGHLSPARVPIVDVSTDDLAERAVPSGAYEEPA